MNASIIILAQHPELLKTCLMDIEIHTDPPYEIIVVNDGADAGIAAVVEHKKRVRLVNPGSRLGVAAGYNRGAAEARSDVLVFVRDYVNVAEQWLSRLVHCLESDKQAAMAGPVSNGVSGLQRVPYECNTVGEIQRTARAVASTHAGKMRKTSRLLSFLLAVRKESFDRLGGFDERFGLETYEDDDLCYRALQSGSRLYIAEDCFVFSGRPANPFPERPDWYDRLLLDNKRKAFEKWGRDITEALAEWVYPATVSLCMIVKNEEQTLGRCLSSVAGLVDEIVIVDTGSEDRTKDIAAEYNCRLFDFEWINDFAKARNYAFGQATTEYILWLDADDVLLPDDAEKFRALLSSLRGDIDYVSMPYHLGADKDGNITSSLRRNRLVRREKAFRWIGMVHEYLEVHGKGFHSDIAVTHRRMHTNSDRNLHIFEQREREGASFGPRDLYYYANELSDHGLWERAVAMYDRFLIQLDGWVEDKINACGRAADALHTLGRTSEAKGKAMQSFAYAPPRAENCCRLGYYYLSEGEYEGAISWYRQATQLPRPTDPMAMLSNACWTWLPHLQLCVCYDRLGRWEEARDHNEAAAAYVPSDSRVLANRRYFAMKMLDAVSFQ